MELSLPLSRRGAYRREDGAGGVAARSRRALDLLRGNRVALRATLALIVVLPLLAGGWLWLRDSSFVAVRHVHITGVHGAEASEIRSALEGAAKRMTTMNFNEAALRSAVASFAIVGAVDARTELPHTVSITVVERPPVAALQSAGQRTAVAADGTVLGPAWLSSGLPLVSAPVEPAAGARLKEGFALEAVTVLGAAPAALVKHVARVYNGSEGLIVAMGNGLLVYFGDSTRSHAKWMSLARVLASPNAAGALYIDVRLPERPAAGFTAPSTVPATAASSSSSASAASSSASSATVSADPTAAALASRLAQASGGEAATSTAATGAQESEQASSASSASTSPTPGAGGSEASASSGSTGSASTGSASTGSGTGEAGGTGQSEAASVSSETASATGGEAAP